MTSSEAESLAIEFMKANSINHGGVKLIQKLGDDPTIPLPPRLASWPERWFVHFEKPTLGGPVFEQELLDDGENHVVVVDGGSHEVYFLSKL